MMRMTKKIYQRPETKCEVGICYQMLASSYVSVGGTGSFDVKEETDWEVIWVKDDIENMVSD